MKIEYEGTEFGDPIEISSTADDTEWEGFSAMKLSKTGRISLRTLHHGSHKRRRCV
jgi:hypothetical protein